MACWQCEVLHLGQLSREASTVCAYAVLKAVYIATMVSLCGQVLACEATREAMQPYVKVFQTLLRCGAAWHALDPMSVPRTSETPSYGDVLCVPFQPLLAQCLAATIILSCQREDGKSVLVIAVQVIGTIGRAWHCRLSALAHAGERGM